ncbi:MAG: glucose 1-dehydrogenase [Alphaproteobacteria bacterium]|nr:glucose 1-dehydrogenase [Alphaproteobacteria bacterium]
MDAKGKVAIVTGSATGVGAEVARQLAERGCKVVINYTRSEAEARDTQQACEAAGAETLLVQADVSNDDDCRRMARAALDEWGRIDILVNNAGTSKFVAHDDLEGLTAEDFQRIYAVNVIGPYQMIRAVAPAMKAQGEGAVVNVSSLAGVRGVGSSVAYAASKGALNNMTMALARALGPEIRVNTVCPGFIQTRWLRQGLGEERFESLKQGVIKSTPLHAASTPVEVAEPILYFALSARHTTGETLLVDAGTHLGAAMRVSR